MKKTWKVSRCTDMTVYNARLANKLRKISIKLLRIAKRYGVDYIDIVAMGDYASVRAKESEGSISTTVVDDYMFATTQED